MYSSQIRNSKRFIPNLASERPGRRFVNRRWTDSSWLKRLTYTGDHTGCNTQALVVHT